MKLAIEVTMRVPGEEPNQHGCSTWETSLECMTMKTLTRNPRFGKGRHVGRRQTFQRDDALIIRIGDEPVGEFKTWDCTSSPNQPLKSKQDCNGKKPRRRHGKGPAFTPKKKKFHPREVDNVMKSLGPVPKYQNRSKKVKCAPNRQFNHLMAELARLRIEVAKQDAHLKKNRAEVATLRREKALREAQGLEKPRGVGYTSKRFPNAHE